MAKNDSIALDYFLSTLLQSREFQSLPHKDWNLISLLVPGTTPVECETRYNELNQELKLAADVKLDEIRSEENFINIPSSRNALSASSGSSGGTISAMNTNEGDASESKPLSRESKGRGNDKHKQSSSNQSSKSRSTGGASSAGAAAIANHANMVIHVCDEAKSIKQDFHCPRSLLVKEMKYFAEYLSLEANRCEDVDISVHCDVQIFDWLMRYVKREGPKTTPKLEPSNAVSILISSDFLKMDSLVQECIEYCADNLEDIVATPCNMNCIQDRLLAVLCNKFNHNQLEALKDKKDKIRSKLFAKKIEQLFDVRAECPDSQYGASSMYKCQYCQKVLINAVQNKVPCLANRMFVEHRGTIMYKHARDVAWDVNEYLISLIRELKSWRNVYWHVWGLVNCLFCSKCNTTFQVRDLGHCLFHSSRMHVEPGDYEGTFSCCGQKSPLFNPLSSPAIANIAGCCVKDHVIDSNARDAHPRMIQDLLKMRNEVCSAYTKPKQPESKDLNIFVNEKQLLPKEESLFDKYSNTVHTPPTGGNNAQSNNSTDYFMEMMLSATDSDSDDDTSLSGASDDDSNAAANQKTAPTAGRQSRSANEDDAAKGGASQKRSHSKKRRDGHQKGGGMQSNIGGGAHNSGACSAGGSRRWDQNRSHRWNQDVQRNEDLRRFTEMTYQLAKLRVQSNADKKELLPPPGGHFARLDSLFRQAVQQASKSSSSGVAGSSSLTYKQGKAKIGQPGKPF